MASVSATRAILLPFDVLYSVVRHVVDVKDLLALNESCWSIHKAVEPILWNFVSFRVPISTTKMKDAMSTLGHDDRGRHIRTLCLSFSSLDREGGTGRFHDLYIHDHLLQFLASVLRSAQNIRTIYLIRGDVGLTELTYGAIWGVLCKAKLQRLDTLFLDVNFAGDASQVVEFWKTHPTISSTHLRRRLLKGDSGVSIPFLEDGLPRLQILQDRNMPVVCAACQPDPSKDHILSIHDSGMARFKHLIPNSSGLSSIPTHLCSKIPLGGPYGMVSRSLPHLRILHIESPHTIIADSMAQSLIGSILELLRLEVLIWEGAQPHEQDIFFSEYWRVNQGVGRSSMRRVEFVWRPEARLRGRRVWERRSTEGDFEWSKVIDTMEILWDASNAFILGDWA